MTMPVVQSRARRAQRPALAALVIVASGLAAERAEAERIWQFQLTPMVQAGSVEGVTELGLLGRDLSIDPGDMLDPLRAGGVLEFEARHRSRLGFRLRYTVQDADGRGGGGVVVDYDQNIGEAVVTYRLGRIGPGAASARDRLEVFGGIRHWDVDVQEAAPGSLRRSADWSDAIVGLRWQRRLRPGLSLLLEGDVGGLGGSDHSWSATGGVVFDRWQRASVYVMYRALGVDYEDGQRGTVGYFRHDTVSHGLLAGVGIRF